MLQEEDHRKSVRENLMHGLRQQVMETGNTAPLPDFTSYLIDWKGRIKSPLSDWETKKSKWR